MTRSKRSRTRAMALGGGTDLCLAESVPATARAVRKTGRSSRGIPILGVRSDLLEFSVGQLVDEFSVKVPQTKCATIRRLTPRLLCPVKLVPSQLPKATCPAQPNGGGELCASCYAPLAEAKKRQRATGSLIP